MGCIVDGIEEEQYDGIGEGTLIFGPYARHSVYGDKMSFMENKNGANVIMIDGKGRKQYSDIIEGTLIFSPDGKHVVFGAQDGDKQFVIVDGKKDSGYDFIIFPYEGGTIIFDSLNSFHYLARKGAGIYLVEEMIINYI